MKEFKTHQYISVLIDNYVIDFQIKAVDPSGVSVYSDKSPRLYFTFAELNTVQVLNHKPHLNDGEIISFNNVCCMLQYYYINAKGSYDFSMEVSENAFTVTKKATQPGHGT